MLESECPPVFGFLACMLMELDKLLDMLDDPETRYIVAPDVLLEGGTMDERREHFDSISDNDLLSAMEEARVLMEGQVMRMKRNIMLWKRSTSLYKLVLGDEFERFENSVWNRISNEGLPYLQRPDISSAERDLAWKELLTFIGCARSEELNENEMLNEWVDSVRWRYNENRDGIIKRVTSGRFYLMDEPLTDKNIQHIRSHILVPDIFDEEMVAAGASFRRLNHVFALMGELLRTVSHANDPRYPWPRRDPESLAAPESETGDMLHPPSLEEQKEEDVCSESKEEAGPLQNKSEDMEKMPQRPPFLDQEEQDTDPNVWLYSIVFGMAAITLLATLLSQ